MIQNKGHSQLVAEMFTSTCSFWTVFTLTAPTDPVVLLCSGSQRFGLPNFLVPRRTVLHDSGNLDHFRNPSAVRLLFGFHGSLW